MTRADADVDAAVAEIAAACRALYDSEQRLNMAHAKRQETAKRMWPALHALGPKWIASELGPGVISEPMVRQLTNDLEPRPMRGPRTNVAVTQEQYAALEEFRTACLAVSACTREHIAALNERHHTVRRLWPDVAHLGISHLVERIGGEIVGESTMRSITADLRRAP